jgi:RNA-directed DNA polymerase
LDPVRALQHALYRAAKADPGRWFHALRDKVYRRDVLWRAWVNVRRNDGAAGIDRITLAMVEGYGVPRLLDQLAADLKDGSYRPLAARRVFICFEAIPREGLMQAVEERVSDQGVLRLLRAMLRAGVLQDGSVRRPVTGTPQGAVVSPLLANVYLHRLDRAWDAREHGVLVRYADDLVVMCRSREQAEAALARLTDLLADLGLQPKTAKTRIVPLQVGGEGFDFLGFHHRLVRSAKRVGTKGVTFLGRWPARKAMQHARNRIRELTIRSRLLLPVEVVVAEVNRFLRGWAAYFRYGNSADHFDKISRYVRMRIALFVSKRHRRSRAFGWYVLAFASSNQLGLIGLHGTVAPPRPFPARRVTPNAGGERRR